MIFTPLGLFLAHRIMPVVALDYEKTKVNIFNTKQLDCPLLKGTDEQLTDLEGGRNRYLGWFTRRTDTDISA